jgi:hypothetical protein
LRRRERTGKCDVGLSPVLFNWSREDAHAREAQLLNREFEERGPLPALLDEDDVHIGPGDGQRESGQAGTRTDIRQQTIVWPEAAHRTERIEHVTVEQAGAICTGDHAKGDRSASEQALKGAQARDLVLGETLKLS